MVDARVRCKRGGGLDPRAREALERAGRAASGRAGMEDDAAEGERRREIGRRFVDAIPWTRALGMEMLELGEGRAVMRAPYDPRFVGDPTTGVIHGGVLTALLDTCSGAAVMSHPSGVTGTATIDLRIDYMRAARPGEAVDRKSVV